MPNYTIHFTTPQQFDDMLLAARRAGGVEALEEAERSLRAEFVAFDGEGLYCVMLEGLRNRAKALAQADTHSTAP